jgi:PAS domain S-box-containing protein
LFDGQEEIFPMATQLSSIKQGKKTAELADNDLANTPEKRGLQESEKRYRSLISMMGNGFVLTEIECDSNGCPNDCRFLEINPAFEQIAGIKAKEVVGKSVADIFPGTEQFWLNKCGKVALSGVSVHFKESSKMFERYFEVIAFCPQKGQVAAVFTDITARMRFEKALSESENNFRAVAENAYDGILIGVKDGAYVYVNRRSSEVTGYSVDELMHMNYRNLIHPDEVNRVRDIYKSRLAGVSKASSFDTLIIKKDGNQLPIEVTSSKTLWHGHPAEMIVIRDITSRKRFEEAMGKINSELERRVSKRTSELMDVAEKLEQKQKELTRHKLDLEKSNRELVQTNTALSVLARNIDRKRDDLEKKIGHIVSSQIMTVIEEIQNDKIPEQTRVKLDVLSAYLDDLTPKSSKSHNVIISLSSMELRIAMMVKNAFSSEEIARMLHISPHTVKTHRKSIRKKLNIKNTNINLMSYLRFKLD